MNGLNSVGAGANAASGPSEADAAGFEAAFTQGLVTTSSVLLLFIGSDILETVMKDETAVD